MSEPALPANATLRDVVRVIERSRRLIAAILDSNGCLLGILSDGDIRRALLAGKGLDSPARDVMTPNPITGPASARDEELLHIMHSRGVAAIPVVEKDGRFARVVQALDFAVPQNQWTGGEGFIAAVVMAGGEGRRLRPLTLNRPKPMIDIGGVPLLERQVRTMTQGGLRRIFIATNYLGHVIEDHFGDGKNFDADIQYLRETKPLGTAGALSLLPELPNGPLLVINGDILTNFDFGKLLEFHRETKAAITVCAVIQRLDISFGVLKIDGHRVIGLEEKPSQQFLCNAGVYVLDAGALARVPADRFFNMTDLIDEAMQTGLMVSVFPIHEYWTDIGNPGDLREAVQFATLNPVRI